MIFPEDIQALSGPHDELVQRARDLVKQPALHAFIAQIDKLNGVSDRAYMRRYRDAAIAIRAVAESGDLNSPMPLRLPNDRRFSCLDTLELLNREGTREKKRFTESAVSVCAISNNIKLENAPLSERQKAAAHAMVSLNDLLQDTITERIEDLAHDARALATPIPQQGREFSR